MNLGRTSLAALLTLMLACPGLTAKTILVPFDTFLVEPNTAEATQAAGWAAAWSGTKALMRGRNPKDALAEKFFNALHAIDQHREQTSRPAVYWKGKKAPEYIYKSLLGILTAQQILEEVRAKIRAHHDLSDKAAIENLAEIAFDPKINAQVMELNPDAWEFIEKLSELGYRVCIIDNYNGESAAALREKYPKLTKFEMVVSGDVRQVKSPEFYRAVFEKLKINKADYIAIETHEGYAQSLKAFDPQAKIVVCTHQEHAKRNVSQAQKEFKKKYGIKT
jgi:FMN phosphatase YigB (HAD superfamily)